MAHYTATVLDDRRIELPAGALDLVQPGQKIEIDLADAVSTSTSMPNKAVLAALNEIAQSQVARAESDGSQTLKFIGEGRDGAMYDYKQGS